MNAWSCRCDAPKIVSREYDLSTRFIAKFCSVCKENELFSGYVSEEVIEQ